MKVFVAGGTGFVGNSVVRELVRRGYDVVVLVRKGSESKVYQHGNVSVVIGNILDPKTLHPKGCSAIINLVGIIKVFPKRGITFEKMKEWAQNR